jgi:hypothetical protein
MSLLRFAPRLLLPSLALASVLVPATPAKAVACATEGSIFSSTTVFGADFSCSIGDKVYNNFNLVSGSIDGINWDWGVVPGVTTNQYTMQGTRTAGLSNFKFTYDLQITAPGFFFDRFRTAAATAVIDSPTFVKTLTPLNAPASTPSVATTPAGGPNSPIATFSPNNLTLINFESELKFTGVPGTNAPAQSFEDTVIQRSPACRIQRTFRCGQEVPGPLPILGVGVALAYSRKVRNRIATSRAI